MSNDITPYKNEGSDGGGDIAPYDPGMPVLAPLSPGPDTWGNTSDTLTNREIDEYQHQRSSGPMLFGTPMPAGTTPQQVQATLAQLGGIYMSDMGSLNYPNHLVQSAISFFYDNATKPARQVRRQHSFTLPKDLTGDWLAESFGNHLSGLSGTQQQKQQFLKASLQWLALLAERGQVTAHGSAPSTADPTDSLNEAQYAAVIKANNAAAAQTEATLRRKWGDSSYALNIQVAQEYLNNLPVNERAHFEQYTTGWIHAMNTVPVVEGLFNMAIGAGNIPTSGGAVHQEIQQIEELIKTNRRAYNKDLQIQARLRVLYNIRDKG